MREGYNIFRRFLCGGFILTIVFGGIGKPSYGGCLVHYTMPIYSPLTALDSSDSVKIADKKSSRLRYIDVSLEYGSNFTYRNQIGSNSYDAPYLFPTILYHDKTGLWASVSAYRLIMPYKQVELDGSISTTAPTWIEADFSAGWDFKIGDKNDGTLSYMYSRFDRNILLVKEAPGNTFEGSFTHDFKLINTGLRGDYTYENFTGVLNGKRVNVPVTDYYASWETHREFYIDEVFSHSDYFEIDPMFTLLAGTDNFIGKFIVARYPSSTKAAHYAAIANQFLIQEFIFDVPVAYNIGNFTFTPSFEYTILTQKTTETAPTSFPIYRFAAAYRFNFK